MSADFVPYDRTLGALDYLAGVAWLAVVLVALGYASVRLRRALVGGWSGPPALVADVVIGLTLAIVLAEILGTFGWFTELGYPVACVLAALGSLLVPARAGVFPPAPAGPRYGIYVVAIGIGRAHV